MPSAKSTRRSVRNSFYGSRPRFTSASTRAAHTLTRKNLKNTSNPELKEALKKAFAIVKAAKAAKSAKSVNAGPRRESTSSLRRATLAALKEKKEEEKRVADALRIHKAQIRKDELKLIKEEKAKKEALAKLEEEKAEASRIAAAKKELEEKRTMLRKVKVTSENINDVLDELSRILNNFKLNNSPAKLSPIAEGGTRRKRR